LVEPIRYEDLLEAYQVSLTTVLRGFTAGVPFLEAWVPDEDHAYSVAGIVEAAREEGLPEVSVVLTPERLAQIDLPILEQLCSEQGEFSLAESVVRVRFREGTRQAAPRLRARAAEVRSEEAERTETSRPELQRTTGFEIPDSYTATLRRLVEATPHRGALPEPSLGVSRLGVTLQVQVAEAPTWTITRAGFTGGSGDTVLLLELFCNVIEGLPLYEAADHGALILEGRLRDRSQPRLVPGIVLPAVGAGFALLQTMIRELWSGVHGAPVENFFDPPVSESWRRLSAEGRIQLLASALAAHPLAAQASVVRVEGQRRVVVGFVGDLSNERKQGALSELERYFKEKVERQLHLYLEPKMDANRLRQQKGIQL